MAQQRLNKLTEALAEELGVPLDDSVLQAVSVAIRDTLRSLYRVAAAKDGSVKIYIHNGWIENSAMELLSLPDPENRRPKGVNRE